MKHLINRLKELMEEIKEVDEKLIKEGLMERKEEDVEWIYQLLKELEEDIEEGNVDSAFCNIEDIESELELIKWSL